MVDSISGGVSKPLSEGPLLTHHTSNHKSSSVLILIIIRIFLIFSLTFPIVVAVDGERVEGKGLHRIYTLRYVIS